MKHSQRTNSEFGRPAGNSGEIRIRRWTQSSRWRGLVIPISCIGAYIGEQARREETDRLLQGSNGNSDDFSLHRIMPTNRQCVQQSTTQLFLSLFLHYFYSLPIALNTTAHFAKTGQFF